MATQVQARDAMQFINEQDAATLERFIERLEFRAKDPTFIGLPRGVPGARSTCRAPRRSWISAAAPAS